MSYINGHKAPPPPNYGLQNCPFDTVFGKNTIEASLCPGGCRNERHPRKPKPNSGEMAEPSDQALDTTEITGIDSSGVRWIDWAYVPVRTSKLVAPDLSFLALERKQETSVSAVDAKTEDAKQENEKTELKLGAGALLKRRGLKKTVEKAGEVAKMQEQNISFELRRAAQRAEERVVIWGNATPRSKAKAKYEEESPFSPQKGLCKSIQQVGWEKMRINISTGLPISIPTTPNTADELGDSLVTAKGKSLMRRLEEEYEASEYIIQQKAIARTQYSFNSGLLARGTGDDNSPAKAKYPSHAESRSSAPKSLSLPDPVYRSHAYYAERGFDPYYEEGDDDEEINSSIPTIEESPFFTISGGLSTLCRATRKARKRLEGMLESKAVMEWLQEQQKQKTIVLRTGQESLLKRRLEKLTGKLQEGVEKVVSPVH